MKLNPKTKSILRTVNDISSQVIFWIIFALLFYTLLNTVTAIKKGEDTSILGHRFILVLTGSMEPYMMTDSICLTRNVDSIDEIAVGDVITFRYDTNTGPSDPITHRIVEIDGETIYTKGDNNRVDDGIPLTMDNVESKVIAVFNQTAWLAAKAQTPAGLIMILSFVASIVLVFASIKMYFRAKREEHEITVRLVDEYNYRCHQLGKTPREMFEQDLARLQEQIDALPTANSPQASNDEQPSSDESVQSGEVTEEQNKDL